MTMDAETVYRHLGRLIEAMPEFDLQPNLSTEQHLWVGRADAIVMEYGDVRDQVDWRVAVNTLRTAARPHALESIRNILYRLLANAELKAPVGVQGSFIPVGNSFDAFAALSKILNGASKDVLIVDPYMDEAVLVDFSVAIPEKVQIRLLSDRQFSKPTFLPAAYSWASQYGSDRPLQVRLTDPKMLHDRAIFIDNARAWTLTQSLKDFAKRSPAEIVRADDTAQLKMDAYESLWLSADVIL